VRDLLREHLLHSGGRRGERLPHEHTLIRELGCSRNVLREALALLAADGLIRRERGRGTHVLTTSPPISIDEGLDLGAAIRDEVAPRPAARAVSYRVLRIGAVRAPPMLAGLLGVPPGTPVSHIERLVQVEGWRVGHWDLHVTGTHHAAAVAALARTEMTEPLLRALGLSPDYEEVRVEAITPSPRTAELLYRGGGHQPTLRLTRQFCDARRQVLALAIGRCALPGATFSVTRRCVTLARRGARPLHQSTHSPCPRLSRSSVRVQVFARACATAALPRSRGPERAGSPPRSR
jgi:DNA-binding GntR family transcriptional regulator